MPKEGAGKKPVNPEAKKEKKPKQAKDSEEGGDDDVRNSIYETVLLTFHF